MGLSATYCSHATIAASYPNVSIIYIPKISSFLNLRGGAGNASNQAQRQSMTPRTFTINIHKDIKTRLPKTLYV